MTIADLLPFFEAELDRLGGRLDGSIHDLVHCLSTDGSREADAACLLFAAEHKWPSMEPRVKLEVCLRLAMAVWYCRELKDRHLEDEPVREFIESTLVEYWHDVGRTDWLYEFFVQPAINRPPPGTNPKSKQVRPASGASPEHGLN